MPVLSVLERLWYYFSFTQLSLWHHETVKRLKEAISKDIAQHLTEADLPMLTTITNAITKALM